MESNNTILDNYRTPEVAKLNRKAPLRCSRSKEAHGRSPKKFPTGYDAGHLLTAEYESALNAKIVGNKLRDYNVESLQKFNNFLFSEPSGTPQNVEGGITPFKTSSKSLVQISLTFLNDFIDQSMKLCNS